MSEDTSPDPGGRDPMLPNLDSWDARLPKWPQMRVSGLPVTTEQAKEIIRRTDNFFLRGYGGRDKIFNRDLARRVGMPHHHDLIDYGNQTLHEMLQIDRQGSAWITAWGGIETTFVRNDWISTSLFRGPSGWCAPDGSIHQAHNVGSHPCVAAIEDDWAKIARAFPFLDLAATLMDREACEAGSVPVVTLLVRGGRVHMTDGDLRHHGQFPIAEDLGEKSDDKRYEKTKVNLLWACVRRRMGLSPRSDGPIPDAWYREWAQIGQAIDPQAIDTQKRGAS